MNINAEDFDKKMGSGPFYFLNAFENAAIRTVPVDGDLKCWVKFKGGKEFQTSYENNIISAAQMDLHELTKEEYDKF